MCRRQRTIYPRCGHERTTQLTHCRAKKRPNPDGMCRRDPNTLPPVVDDVGICEICLQSVRVEAHCLLAWVREMGC